MATLLKDDAGIPIPQYSDENDAFQKLRGTDGKMWVTAPELVAMLTDTTVIKADVANIAMNVATLQTDLSTVKSDLSITKNDINSCYLTLSAISNTLDAIRDVLINISTDVNSSAQLQSNINTACALMNTAMGAISVDVNTICNNTQPTP